jgi:hypothetical protein
MKKALPYTPYKEAIRNYKVAIRDEEVEGYLPSRDVEDAWMTEIRQASPAAQTRSPIYYVIVCQAMDCAYVS